MENESRKKTTFIFLLLDCNISIHTSERGTVEIGREFIWLCWLKQQSLFYGNKSIGGVSSIGVTLRNIHNFSVVGVNQISTEIHIQLDELMNLALSNNIHFEWKSVLLITGMRFNKPMKKWKNVNVQEKHMYLIDS
ncbi:hypothetical protein AAAZ63_21440 [Bacteroides xylanisolvens]|uniref:hypothetical protein n=1 Tax=Bacteroides xylanisolvens TaxID=371601 RepID=UPI0032C05354